MYSREYIHRLDQTSDDTQDYIKIDLDTILNDLDQSFDDQ